MSLSKALTAAAGNAGGGAGALYVEDVFSTYLYDGQGTGVNNIDANVGVDLLEHGGLVYIKNRESTDLPLVFDTERGVRQELRLDNAAASANDVDTLTAFTNTGYKHGDDPNIAGVGEKHVSYVFRKQEKFFDIVEYTGTGTAQWVDHNLGCKPAFIIIKCTTNIESWTAYTDTTSTGATGYWPFSTSSSFNTNSDRFNNDEPTETQFRVGSATETNESTQTFIAYLFASGQEEFGSSSDQAICKVGEYTIGGSNNNINIDLGFEPQLLFIKRVDATENWWAVDYLRGATNGSCALLEFNDNVAELVETNGPFFTSTGWSPQGLGVNRTYVYIAIRRPMKTPESGTEVFAVDEANSGTNPNFYSGFPVDVSIRKFLTNSTQSPELETRLTNKKLETAQTAAENATDSGWWDWQDGVSSSGHGTGTFAWMFKRATGFFDVVAYTGNGTASRQITHNLGSAPGMIIVKCRNATNTYWNTWHSSLPDDGSWASNLFLNSTDGYAGYQRFDGAATQTADYFTTGNNGEPNTSGRNYIAYLFGSVAGVSKVGSYTGTGSNVDVDCGFSAGARFILIKRTDSTGDWYVYDSVRGIVAGNDPYLLLNSTAAEVTSTDYIDPLSSGFTVTSSAPAALNASGGTYIFLAIA